MPKRMQTIVVGSFMVNAYLYWDDDAAQGVIVDPGDEGETIITAVEKAGFAPRAILLTHGHVDHIGAVKEVKARFDIPLYVGRGEEHLLSDPQANGSAFLAQPITAPPPDELLDDEQELRAGKLRFRVLATPGHSPGGVCYLDEREGILFCGDTLFQGSIGRTDLPGGSTELLLDSIREKILRLPNGIVCLPGHGPQTTVGAERNGNPFLTGGYFV